MDGQWTKSMAEFLRKAQVSRPTFGGGVAIAG